MVSLCLVLLVACGPDLPDTGAGPAGDGWVEMLVGATGDATGGTGAGAVFVVYPE